MSSNVTSNVDLKNNNTSNVDLKNTPKIDLKNNNKSNIDLKPKNKNNNTFEVIIIFILVIILLIFLTTTLYYLRRRAECYTYPSPWCYSDWICDGLPADQQNRWDVLKNLKLSTVSSEEGLCFLADGTPNPECANVWMGILNQGSTCSGPAGTGPCSTPYTRPNN